MDPDGEFSAYKDQVGALPEQQARREEAKKRHKRWRQAMTNPLSVDLAAYHCTNAVDLRRAQARAIVDSTGGTCDRGVIQWSFLLGLSRPQSVAAVLDAAGIDTIEQFKDVKINGPGDPMLSDKFDLIKTVYAQCPDGSKVHAAKSSPDDLRRFVRLQDGEVHAEVRTVNKQVSRPDATIQRRKGSEASETAVQDAQPTPEPVPIAPADEQPVQTPGLTFNAAPWRVRGLMLVLKIVSPWGFVGDQSELRNRQTGEIVPLTKRNVRALLNDPERSDLPDDWPEADRSIDAHQMDDPAGAEFRTSWMTGHKQ